MPAEESGKGSEKLEEHSREAHLRGRLRRGWPAVPALRSASLHITLLTPLLHCQVTAALSFGNLHTDCDCAQSDCKLTA